MTQRRDDLAETPSSPARAPFHTLTVSRVEPLCDDAAAVTFEVPDDLGDRDRVFLVRLSRTHGGAG